MIDDSRSAQSKVAGSDRHDFFYDRYSTRVYVELTGHYNITLSTIVWTHGKC